jgi:hypothetical protein
MSEETKEYDLNGDLSGFFNPLDTSAEPTPTSQGSVLPDIEIPEGHALAGRYKSLEDLETHAGHFQSEFNKLQNDTKEAVELKQVLDTNPQLYETLAQRLAEGDAQPAPQAPQAPPQSTGDPSSDWDSLWADEPPKQTPAQSPAIDPQQVQNLVDQRVNAALGQYHQEVTAQQQQKEQDQALYNNYRTAGGSEEDFNKDIEFAQSLEGMPKDQLLATVSKLRRMNEQGIPAPQGGMPRSITNIAGSQARGHVQDEGDKIITAGRRSVDSLFK